MTRTIWLSGRVQETPSPRCGQRLRDSVTFLPLHPVCVTNRHWAGPPHRKDWVGSAVYVYIWLQMPQSIWGGGGWVWEPDWSWQIQSCRGSGCACRCIWESWPWMRHFLQAFRHGTLLQPKSKMTRMIIAMMNSGAGEWNSVSEAEAYCWLFGPLLWRAC